MMNSQKKYSQKGLSLVEVLVSMTLMTVLIVAISTPLAGLFKYSKESKDSVEANAAARSALETARSSWQSYPWISTDDPDATTINTKMQNLNIASRIRFLKNCAGPDVLEGITHEVQFEIFQLDRYNEASQSLDASNFTRNCDDPDVTIGPNMSAKRIQISVIDADGNKKVAAHVDVRIPPDSIPSGDPSED